MYFSTFALKLKINITILSDIVKQYPSLQMVTDCQFLPRETCSPERVQPKEITRPVIKKVIHLFPIHVVTFTLISNLATDYIQKKRREPGLFSFEYNLLTKLISK